MKHISCAEKMKREKLHKVAVIEFCSIAQIKKLLKSMYETIETYIMFRKRWKGKVAQSGGSRASWWEKQETEVCSGNKGAMLDYILYIFHSYIVKLYIVYTVKSYLVNCQIHIVKLYCTIASCKWCMKTLPKAQWTPWLSVLFSINNCNTP